MLKSEWLQGGCLLLFILFHAGAQAQSLITGCLQNKAEFSIFFDPSTDLLNFTDSLARCADIGLSLARVDNGGFHTEIRELMKANGSTTDVWVGLLSNKTDALLANTAFDFFFTDEIGNLDANAVRFIHPSAGVGFPWQFNKPSSVGLVNNCASMIQADNFDMADVDCLSLRGFVCRRDCTPTTSPTVSPTEFVFFQQKGNVIGISIVGVAGAAGLVGVIVAGTIYGKKVVNDRKTRLLLNAGNGGYAPKKNVLEEATSESIDFALDLEGTTATNNSFDTNKIKRKNKNDDATQVLTATGVLSVDRVMATNPAGGEFDPKLAQSKMVQSAAPKSSYLRRIFSGKTEASLFRPSSDYINKAEVKKKLAYEEKGIPEFAPKNVNRKKRGRGKRPMKGNVSLRDDDL